MSKIPKIQKEKLAAYSLISIYSDWFIRKEYIAFENAINPMIAEKMTGEKSRDYMNARRVAKEYEAITRGLDRAFLSLPPCGSIEEIKQVIYLFFT